MKQCKKCNVKKQFSEFNKHATNLDGVAGACKECQRAQQRDRYRANPEATKSRYRLWKLKNKERAKELERSWRKSNKGYTWKYHLKGKYGLTIAQYDEMLKSQNNQCKICAKDLGTKRKNIHIDHCHKTNRIRGILCINCNTLLGHALDSVSVLSAAINYLNSK